MLGFGVVLIVVIVLIIVPGIVIVIVIVMVVVISSRQRPQEFHFFANPLDGYVANTGTKMNYNHDSEV